MTADERALLIALALASDDPDVTLALVDCMREWGTAEGARLAAWSREWSPDDPKSVARPPLVLRDEDVTLVRGPRDHGEQ